jgi:hypothetical protein
VDKVTLKKAEARISTVKIEQPIAFLFISFYPLGMLLAEAALGGGKASGEAAATRPSPYQVIFDSIIRKILSCFPDLL